MLSDLPLALLVLLVLRVVLALRALLVFLVFRGLFGFPMCPMDSIPRTTLSRSVLSCSCPCL
ncbi:hypothetical protein BN2537_9363 [Streptomyces venezuelae]|nr:hypothetical protein BN2537_9363 [Streptomyces venezuelae]